MRIIFTLPGLSSEDMRGDEAERFVECVRQATGAHPAQIRFEEAEDGSPPFPADTLPPRDIFVHAAEQLVRDFLSALEVRDLEKAAAMTAPGFRMVFPGPAIFDDFESLIAWAVPRYRWVKKKIERVDGCTTDDESIIVYCLGTLYGEWPSGTPFSDIRFIDRFLIRSEKLVRQDVWNDLADVGSQ